MKKILIPQEAWVTPRDVINEISKFEHINKSPYSKTYYNVPDVTWEYKPEGSLRISDHWNFMSRGEKHCLLENTDEYVQNNWILAEYKEGKYHLLKEFGTNIRGYKFIDINKDEIVLIKELYEKGGIIKSKLWYRAHKIRPKLAKELHIKNRKDLLKDINKDRLKIFKEANKEIKKVIYLSDYYMNVIDYVTKLYKLSFYFEKLCASDEGVNEIKSSYKTIKIMEDDIESIDKVYFLMLDNGLIIELSEEQIGRIIK